MSRGAELDHPLAAADRAEELRLDMRRLERQDYQNHVPYGADEVLRRVSRESSRLEQAWQSHQH
jgi:hypothetical protein